MDYYIGPVHYGYFFPEELEVLGLKLCPGDNMLFEDPKTRTVSQIRAERNWAKIEIRLVHFNYIGH